MLKVTAKNTFSSTDLGNVPAGATFNCSEAQAKHLAELGLVEYETKATAPKVETKAKTAKKPAAKAKK